MQKRFRQYIPFAGESAGLIRDILPAAEIVQRIGTETVEILKSYEKFWCNET